MPCFQRKQFDGILPRWPVIDDRKMVLYRNLIKSKTDNNLKMFFFESNYAYKQKRGDLRLVGLGIERHTIVFDLGDNSKKNMVVVKSLQ
tara:strand:- start:395 stop:661 length:267 start_codon:yes stop_codon:yes gene_type:complete